MWFVPIGMHQAGSCEACPLTNLFAKCIYFFCWQLLLSLLSKIPSAKGSPRLSWASGTCSTSCWRASWFSGCAAFPPACEVSSLVWGLLRLLQGCLLDLFHNSTVLIHRLALHRGFVFQPFVNLMRSVSTGCFGYPSPKWMYRHWKFYTSEMMCLSTVSLALNLSEFCSEVRLNLLVDVVSLALVN